MKLIIIVKKKTIYFTHRDTIPNSFSVGNLSHRHVYLFMFIEHMCFRDQHRHGKHTGKFAAVVFFGSEECSGGHIGQIAMGEGFDTRG